MTQYDGAGITGFGLIGTRESDSIGIGSPLPISIQPFERQHEPMFQARCQAHLFAAALFDRHIHSHLGLIAHQPERSR